MPPPSALGLGVGTPPDSGLPSERVRVEVDMLDGRSYVEGVMRPITETVMNLHPSSHKKG